MARRGPSLTALPGMLAVAGFQNQDKISELARRVQSSNPRPTGSSDMSRHVSDLMGGSPVGATL